MESWVAGLAFIVCWQTIPLGVATLQPHRDNTETKENTNHRNELWETAWLFNSFGGVTPPTRKGRWHQAHPLSTMLEWLSTVFSSYHLSPSSHTASPPTNSSTPTLSHPPSSINLSGRSMPQRITKSYQLKPCQISKHNHYVNPSLLLLHKDGLALSVRELWALSEAAFSEN